MKAVVDSLGKAVDSIGNAFDKNFTSKEEVLTEVRKAEQVIIEAKQSVLLAEANGNKLQRSWRPILMIMFGSIIAYKMTLAPILLHFFSIPEPVLVPDFWETIRLAMGGYVIGRTAEKVAPSVANIIPTVTEAAKKAIRTRKERRQARKNERQN